MLSRQLVSGKGDAVVSLGQAARLMVRRNQTFRTALGGPLALRRRWQEWRQRSGMEAWQRLAAIACEDVVVRVPEYGGCFALSPSSHLTRRLLLEGEYEPEYARVFFDYLRPELDVIDVGANVGFFAVAAARQMTTGRLLAIEPTAAALRRLRGNLERNQVDDRVILFSGLAGAAAGVGTIHWIPGMEEYSSMRSPAHPSLSRETGVVMAETVPMQSLDALVELHGLRPAVIKVDVEGAEYSVFRGAQATLAKFRPVVISELWRSGTEGSTSRDVLSMFAALDYLVRNPLQATARPGTLPIDEIICIPKEREVSGVNFE